MRRQRGMPKRAQSQSPHTRKRSFMADRNCRLPPTVVIALGGPMGREDGVAAVERALLILDAMSEDRVSLAELTSRTGLVKSTVLRIAKSLEKFGYLLRSDEGLYRIGPKPYQIGCVYKRHYLASEILLPVLKHIVEELQEGASFYVLEGDTRICLH